MLYQKLSSVLPLDTHEYRFEITPISASKLLRWKGPKISICEISVDLCLNIAARCPNFRGKLVVLENVEDERRTFWKNLWVGAKYHPRKFFVYLPKYLSEPPWPIWSAHPCMAFIGNAPQPWEQAMPDRMELIQGMRICVISTSGAKYKIELYINVVKIVRKLAKT